MQSNKWVLFDMDGTLWDAVDLIVTSWQAVCDSHPELDVTIDRDTLQGLLGQTMDAFAATVFPMLSKPEAEALVHECEQLENSWAAEHGAHLYPGVEETFCELIRDGWHLGIVSNCQSGYLEAFLSYYGFGKYIEDTLCFGDNGRPKGENIRLMLDRNHADFGCYIGDTVTDQEACAAAGVPFYWASYGFGEAKDAPEIADIRDFPAALRSAAEKQEKTV